MQTLWVDRMIGKQATIPDIVLELQELVQPIDLYCHEESLETEEATEEELCYIPYKIVAPCVTCGAKLRLYLLATDHGIRTQQDLLLREVQLLCPVCREKIRNE